ncbi:MAG: alanine dehydrogenase [Patescibacteria group bacterium]|jgi:alanine dehydrogenase
MTIGTVREIKTEETRVGLIPSTIAKLKEKGHRVLVEKNAGLLAGIKDQMFQAAGAEVFSSAAEIWKESNLVIKVKEPQEAEYGLLRKDQILFTYFHFASNLSMTDVLIKKGVNCLAYELVEHKGNLPLLTPMSEIAGRLAAQEGAEYLKKNNGGKGLLLSGAAGIAPGKAIVIGAGVVGINAARIAAGLGAEVTILDVNLERLRYLESVLLFNCRLIYSNQENLLKEIKAADLIIGAVLIPAAAAPRVILKEDLKLMEEGTVLVDVAIDQGGCFETSRPTSHNHPVYEINHIIHYCVPNMPAAVPKTSTYALNYATAPYILALAETGGDLYELDQPRALYSDLKSGLAVYNGEITNQVLAGVLRKN